MSGRNRRGKLVALVAEGGDHDGLLCVSFEKHELDFLDNVSAMYPGVVRVKSYRECTLLEADEFKRRCTSRVQGNWYRPTQAVRRAVAFN